MNISTFQLFLNKNVFKDLQFAFSIICLVSSLSFPYLLKSPPYFQFMKKKTTHKCLLMVHTFFPKDLQKKYNFLVFLLNYI